MRAKPCSYTSYTGTFPFLYRREKRKHFVLFSREVALLAQEAWRGAEANGTTVAPCSLATSNGSPGEDEIENDRTDPDRNQ